MSDVEHTVSSLLDRQQILDCLTRCARGVDRLDRELIVSAYHDDAIDDHGKFLGTPREFADWVIDMHRTHHLTHQHCLFNHSCDLDGATAHTETYYMFVAINRDGPVLAMSGGRYIDRLEKRGGQWAIAHRVLIREWAAVDERPDIEDLTAFTATAASVTPAVRAFMNGGAGPRRDRTDASYRRPLEVDAHRLSEWAALRGQ